MPILIASAARALMTKGDATCATPAANAVFRTVRRFNCPILSISIPPVCLFRTPAVHAPVDGRRQYGRPRRQARRCRRSPASLDVYGPDHGTFDFRLAPDSNPSLDLLFRTGCPDSANRGYRRGPENA